LINCFEHFLLFFFCLQIKFPQLFAMFQCFSASAAGRAFILTGACNKMSSSETESTASDMSDLSYEQELGEAEEGPLQH
jgi:hypothetical protein